jgi:hypothetical protein
MTLFIDLGCLYCKQTQRAFNVFKNALNWLKIYSVDKKLFKIQLTRVWEFYTRRWNALHRERRCVFTAGGERVKADNSKLNSPAWCNWHNTTPDTQWVFRSWHSMSVQADDTQWVFRLKFVLQKLQDTMGRLSLQLAVKHQPSLAVIYQ